MKVKGGVSWDESAARSEIAAHENGKTIVASGDPEALEAWLTEVQESVEDVVRIGPMARPGMGGA